MVHSKVIVVDPIGPEPVVITGSHNLGPKASSGNDENLVIIKNNSDLARAYAVNIMSIYNQYRWRFWQLTSQGARHYSGIMDDDQWQYRYFKGPAKDELDFWLGV
jgi:phosphatidylserine/phosphatidylglycerophosphate/cardiolipin synthase-like enzyme